MFRDRADAGQQLSRELQRFSAAKPLVLGLPRGGVVIGAEVARALACELDVLLVKKLRAPGNPELALGAISEEGSPYINEDLVRLTGADDSYVQGEIKERLVEIQQQQELYRAVKPRISPTARTVIVVDDGLATGATMIAAAQATAMAQPQQLVVAAPVGSIEAAATLAKMKQVDELICTWTPDWFGGVGQFYADFTQVSDEEVAAILKVFA